MRPVALALLTLALLPAAAHARDRHRPMTFNFAAVVAVDYWTQRGIHVPCHPRPVLLTDRQTADWDYSVDMLADVPTCAVEITPWADWRRTDREYAWLYCRDVVHEIGHLAGLEHDHGGIMGAGNVTPWGCSHPRRFRHQLSDGPGPARTPRRSARSPGPQRQ